ncbi:fimbrial protein [Collimonas fungivorans]|uniref:fimbrial protein n=1 Tax=Collimonas fungivorans TaxID=158899 RepID=UPI0009ED85AA|nr:fimbrial protein [Collimonas fungivorans]
MKKILLTGVACLLATYSLPSMAACSALNGWSGKTITFNFPATIPVQRDLPVGSTISSIITPLVAGTQEYLSCTGASTLLNSAYTNGWVPVSGIAPTNVAGVGIRITFVNQTTPRVVPFELATIAGTFSLINANWTVELIKTGPVSAGQITLGRYAGFAVKSNYWITYINAGSGGQIVPVSCSVSNAAISVPLGDVNLNRFTGPGATVETPGSNFNVALDCDAGTRVNITLDGTHDSSGIAGVLALSPSAGTTAQGAGVQLVHGGTPVALGVPIATGTAAAAGTYNIPLVARYYQTAATVNPGVANSAATFTMTYN